MIPFIDLSAQQKLIRNNIEKRIKKVLDHGQYVLGPEVRELEEKLSILQVANMHYVVQVEQMHCCYP